MLSISPFLNYLNILIVSCVRIILPNSPFLLPKYITRKLCMDNITNLNISVTLYVTRKLCMNNVTNVTFSVTMIYY